MKKHTTVEGYLGELPADQLAALEKLRKQVKAAAPSATEGISYGLIAFKLNGHPLVYLGAARTHCALYGSIPRGFAAKLKNYVVSKGTIRFPPNRPIPAKLVAEIVRAKVAESELRWPPGKKTARTAKS